MWPLLVLLLLGLASCVKTQLLFTTIKSVDYNICNDTILIPCLRTNVDELSQKNMYVTWKFRGKTIFYYDGIKNQSVPIRNFSSAYIILKELLKGNASLIMDKSQAIPGNYICEVAESTRVGETTIVLKYHDVLWMSSNEHMLIIIFPMLAVLMFWGNGIVILKYNSNITKEKIIILSVTGLILSILVIVGVILFTPGVYSTSGTTGLGLIVVPTIILILCQTSMFIIVNGMHHISIILWAIQALGLVITLTGLSFSISECILVHGSLLISRLVITALVSLLGLVYLIFVVCSKKKTIQPNNKALNK
ncbi:unnamed protein product [Pipistrellus nathusii]|uniref:Leukocyte surface antigen CD47 n=1 Tax=Pipistrellus nathusii TaxID=59473 RepID=A0ABN9ZTP1_PIPNA